VAELSPRAPSPAAAFGPIALKSNRLMQAVAFLGLARGVHASHIAIGSGALCAGHRHRENGVVAPAPRHSRGALSLVVGCGL